MNDLISRQAAIKAIEDLQDCYNGFSDTYDKACIIGVIEEVPSIEPIKHGHWIDEGLVDGNQNRYCRCSECGKGDTQAISQRVPYCWWCGARMDGGENGSCD